MGEGTRVRGGGSKGFGSGGVGGRGTAPELRGVDQGRCKKGEGWGLVGVGGRGTGPRDGANFATCVVFLTFLTRTKRRKIAFFEGFPVGWGRVQGGAERGPRALVPGG